MHTIEEAKQWAAENREQLDKERWHYTQSDPSTQLIARLMPTVLTDLWNAGCWLKETLLASGADEGQGQEVCFLHGRLCVGRCPWEMAVLLANKWEAIPDKPD